MGSLASKTTDGMEVILSKSVKSIPTIISAKTQTDTAVEVTGITQPIAPAFASFKLIASRCLPPQ